MKFNKAMLLGAAAIVSAVLLTGCVTEDPSRDTGDVSICKIRHMSETLQKDLDGPESEDLVETFSGKGDILGAPFYRYIDSIDEMMASDDTKYRFDALAVLKIIRRPTSQAMRSVKDMETVREKTAEWVCAGLRHSRWDVRERALAVLQVLPRGEVDAVVSRARENGIVLLRKKGKCGVCDKGMVSVEVDMGMCPACGGEIVRAEVNRTIVWEKLCKMCHGNGRRSGKLTYVCEHCQGDWERCLELSCFKDEEIGK